MPILRDTITEKLEYIYNIKNNIFTAIKNAGSNSINNDTLFEDYPDKIEELFSDALSLCDQLYLLIYGHEQNENERELTSIQNGIVEISDLKVKLVDNLIAQGQQANLNMSIDELLDMISNIN